MDGTVGGAREALPDRAAAAFHSVGSVQRAILAHLLRATVAHAITSRPTDDLERFGLAGDG